MPSIASLDGDGVVSYVGSFSKITGPGMRLGYVAASEEMLLRLRPIKSGGGVNQFASWAIHRFAERHLDDHIRKINGVQRVKRDAMLSALGENFGSEATWSRPNGGLYVWLELTRRGRFRRRTGGQRGRRRSATRQVLYSLPTGYRRGTTPACATATTSPTRSAKASRGWPTYSTAKATCPRS